MTLTSRVTFTASTEKSPPMSSVKQLRSRIEKAKRELSRMDGERDALSKQATQLSDELREVLGCEPGEEKAAIKELRKRVKDEEEALEAALDALDESVQ